MPTYTTVVDKTAGDVFTESMWDTYLRDNLNGLLTPPGVHAYRSSGTTSAAGWSTCAFNAEYFDTDGMHSTSVNTERITCVTAGVYLVTAAWHLQEDGSAAGERIIGIALNGEGTPSYGVAGFPYQGNSTVTRLATAAIIKLSVGDYVTLMVYQGDAGALTVYAQASGWSAQFAAHWLGRGA